MARELVTLCQLVRWVPVYTGTGLLRPMILREVLQAQEQISVLLPANGRDEILLCAAFTALTVTDCAGLSVKPLTSEQLSSIPLFRTRIARSARDISRYASTTLAASDEINE